MAAPSAKGHRARFGQKDAAGTVLTCKCHKRLVNRAWDDTVTECSWGFGSSQRLPEGSEEASRHKKIGVRMPQVESPCRGYLGGI